MTDPHHDAARHHQRRGGETELLSSEQGGHHHVSAGLELAVDLHDDPVAKSVEQQRLLSLGQAEFPRRAGVLHRGQRGRAGAAVVPGDQHHIGVRLGHPRRDRADPVLAHQFHVDPRRRVGVLQVIDQLRQIFDRVDVMVRRRGDQAHARRGVPHFGHPRVDLVTRKLAALTGFGALGHLDLDVGAVGQVVAGDAEASGRHLLDGAAAPITVGIALKAADGFPTLTRVRPPAKAIHRDSQCLVGLGRDGSVAHRTGGEPLDDLAGRLHLLQWHRWTHALGELQQATQRGDPLALVVDELGVLLEDRVLPGTS